MDIDVHFIMKARSTNYEKNTNFNGNKIFLDLIF